MFCRTLFKGVLCCRHWTVFCLNKLQGTLSVVPSDRFCKNGKGRLTTVLLKALFDLSIIWIPIFIIFKSDYFQLWFLYRNVLRISPAWKRKGLSELKTFKPKKSIFHILKITISREPMWIGHCHLCMESLRFMLTLPLIWE